MRKESFVCEESQILKTVSDKFFNVMAENFVSETNFIIHSLKNRKAKTLKLNRDIAKIRKLQPES